MIILKDFRKIVPNFLTMLNLACGSIAIIQAFSGNMVLASWFIIIAALMDFLDGFAARLLHAKTSIGAQLDSLADVVSFGLAPAIIMFKLLYEIQANDTGLFDFQFLPYLSLLMVIAGAYRLARFNTDPEQSEEFKGLPIPANGIFVASLPLILHFPAYSSMIVEALNSDIVLVIIVLLLSWLMVSRVRMMSLKFKNLSWADNSYRFILIILLVFLFILVRFSAIPLIILIYIIFSLLNSKNLSFKSSGGIKH